jgi:hypothetical protein
LQYAFRVVEVSVEDKDRNLFSGLLGAVYLSETVKEALALEALVT